MKDEISEDEFAKYYEYRIIRVKTRPVGDPTIVFTDILSHKDSERVVNELKNNNLGSGTYLAFEEKGSTFLYFRRR